MPWRAALLWWAAAAAAAWELSGLAPADSVRHVTIWRSRAFLSAERRDPAQEGTLLEVAWPEPGPGMPAAWAKPRAARLFPPQQAAGDCERPQSAVATAAELRGRLWLLDAAANGCHPKIAIYDLISLHNQQLLVCELRDAGEVTGLAVDGGLGGGGPRAYVSLGGRPSLLVFSQRERRWWLLHADARPEESTPGPPPPVPCQHVALGRAGREPVLFLTADNSSLLCTLPLQKLRAEPAPPVADSRPAELRAQAQCPGSKLGPSACLAADGRGGALYFLSRDGAAVRWDSRRPLSAESHTVLLPPAAMATPRQLFLAQGRLWALTPPTADSDKHCSLVSRSLPPLPPLLLPKRSLRLKPHQ